MKAIGLIFLFSLLYQTAKAEYRVFTLHLLNTKINSVRLIRTTLDPDQYKSLYPLNPDEKLTYVQTWRCKGRTDSFKPHCEKPLRQPTSAQN